MLKIVTAFSRFGFATEMTKSAVPVFETASGRDKYRNFKKDGPELFLTRILMVNGPLTNKELWRIY